MIDLSNGHSFEFMTASGALAFDGRGWWWDWPFVWTNRLDTSLFTKVIKSLTRHEKEGNRRWYDILGCGCVRFIKDGTINAVGLTNPGISWWMENVAPHVTREMNLVGSIFGDDKELVEMARRMDKVALVALEVNYSCPNTGHMSKDIEPLVRAVKLVDDATHHPVIIKLSVAQPYVAIVQELKGIAEAVSLNSVPASIFFYDKSVISPLHCLGGGGISGKAAQFWNWKAVEELAADGSLPVIGPSPWCYEDIGRLFNLRAKAVSFGAVHIPNFWKPWTWRNPTKPTRWVRRWEREELARDVKSAEKTAVELLKVVQKNQIRKEK